MVAVKSKGLGKGLSALFAEEAIEPAATSAESSSASQIPAEQIIPNKDQPRRIFDETEINSLASSIKKNGIIQPILVRPLAEGGIGKARYQIVAGERRWRAAKLAGLETLPVIVKELSDTETLEIAIIENIQRQDLSPLEEASAYKKLMDDFSLTQETVASRVGKSRSHVANLVRLLSLPSEVKEMIEKGELTMGHARALLSVENPLEEAKRIKSEGLTVRDVERIAKGVKFSAETANTNDKKSHKEGKRDRYISDSEVSEIERTISESIGANVTINNHGSKGELTIRYESLEQLDILIQKICA